MDAEREARIVRVLGPVALRQKRARLQALSDRIESLRDLEGLVLLGAGHMTFTPGDPDFPAAAKACSRLAGALRDDVTFVELWPRRSRELLFTIRMNLECHPWFLQKEDVLVDDLAEAWERA